MKDLKIRVDNDAESREVQELFFELGYKWFSGGNQVQHLKQSCSSSFGYLVAWSSGCFTDVIQCGCGNEDAKEITLPELRDLVVLKRNDVQDATHKSGIGRKGYLASGGIEYIWSYSDSTWFKPEEMNFKSLDIKPIEKPMKEYLIKSGDGKYLLTHHDSIGAIEIPEGCNIITCENRKGNLVYFHWKSLDSDEFFLKDEKIWSNNFDETLFDFIEKNEGDVAIIWSRYTHPEELPFIDDEPLQSLNDQYAEIEKVRQHNHYFKDVSSLNEIDVYMVLKLFNVTDPCLQHIAKKALCVGQRGHKDLETDLRNIFDTAKRALEINGFGEQ